MQIARSPEEAGFVQNSIVTIGTFDGMHLGHRAIIAEVKGRSRAVTGRSVIVTFDPHPRLVVGKGPVELLTTLDERLELFRLAGVDLTMVLEFTYGFSRQPAAEIYERHLLRGTGVSDIV